MAERIEWDSLSEELQDNFNYRSFRDEDDFILVEEGNGLVMVSTSPVHTYFSVSLMVNTLLKTGIALETTILTTITTIQKICMKWNGKKWSQFNGIW